jgi:hypothetical protein
MDGLSVNRSHKSPSGRAGGGSAESHLQGRSRKEGLDTQDLFKRSFMRSDLSVIENAHS